MLACTECFLCLFRLKKNLLYFATEWLRTHKTSCIAANNIYHGDSQVLANDADLLHCYSCKLLKKQLLDVTTIFASI